MKEYAVTLHLYPDHAALGREQRLLTGAEDFAAALGRPKPDLALDRQASGKPFFPHAPWLHFSVSHSGDYWLLGLSLALLGVDIQKKRPVDHNALAKRWFSATEYAYVAQGGPDAFFAVWCAREAVLKLIGCGLASQPRDFSLVEAGQLRQSYGDAALLFPDLAPGYAACVAGAKGELNLIRHDV